MNRIAPSLSAALLLGLLGMPALPVGAQDLPEALVVRVQGEVRLEPAGGQPGPATVGARLAVGDRVVPSTGSQAVVVRKTGQSVTVTEPYTVQAAAGGDEEDRFARAAGVLARAANTDAGGRGGRQGMIRPVPGVPETIAPRNGIMILDTRPSFAWHPADSGSAYTVQIQRQGAGYARYPAGGDTVWSYPADAPPLIPGATYVWTVASESGRVARPQEFRIADPETYTDVAMNLQALSEMGLEPERDGLLLAAIVYLDTGLFYDALVALRALETDEERLGPDVLLLMGEALAAMGRYDEAEAAWQAADRQRQR